MMNVLSVDYIDDLWKKLDKKLSRVAISARNKLPYTTENGIYNDLSSTNPNFWTNGFFPGMMWLMYDATKNPEYRTTAEVAEKLMDAALKNINKIDHDAGFLWHLSSGASYRLTGNTDSYVRNMYAANLLMSRYNLKGGFIRAWNEEIAIGVTIIDCMMNLPLLYWASKETKDQRYKYIAMSHADKAMEYHVRADGSVNHMVKFNPETGEPVEFIGGQGYCEGSSWSRGQAWGLYGFTLSYIHTGEQRYLDIAKNIAHYFIAACCDDYLPKCDFRAPKEPVVYDSSAGLVAANGLIELSRIVKENERDMYFNAACSLVKAVAENFTDWSDETESIVTHGTEAYFSMKHHIPMVYSDFYFVEAINKLKGFNTFLW